MAMASFYEALNPTEPKKRYKMKRYGLGGMFDRQGNLAGIEQIDAAFDTFFKKFPKTADRNKRLAEIFANSADALIEVFNTYDFKKLKAARDRVTDLPGAQEEREKTLDEQIEKSKKLRAGIKKKLYAPAEEWSAGLMHSLNTSLQGAFDLSKNPKLEKAWSAGIPVGIVGAGLAAAIFGGKAWKGIVGGVRGMGGLGGMLGKLGMAKALEKAAGVQPVFVVNANEMGRGAGGEIGRIIENQSGARWVDLAGGSNAPLPLPTPAMPRGLWGTGGYAPWVPSAIGTATILSVGALAIYGVQRYVEEAQVAEETAEHQEEHTRELLKKRPKLERGVIRNVEHEGKKFHWTQDRIEFEIGTRLDELRHPPQRGAPPRMRPTFTPDSPTKFDPNVFNIPNGTPNPYFSQTTMVMPPRENIVRDDETVRALGRAALDLSAAAKELKKNAHDRNLDHRGH
jgi:hypothetical protein